jgi:predicted ribosomally synthesized peptide with nif11-like leader
MSTQAIQAFAAKLQQDEAFRKQVQGVLVAAQQRSTAELLKVATGAGFSFTEAELATAVQERLKQRHAAGELKDEDLLQVAGGITPAIGVVATVWGMGAVIFATVQYCDGNHATNPLG